MVVAYMYIDYLFTPLTNQCVVACVSPHTLTVLILFLYVIYHCLFLLTTLCYLVSCSCLLVLMLDLSCLAAAYLSLLYARVYTVEYILLSIHILYVVRSDNHSLPAISHTSYRLYNIP